MTKPWPHRSWSWWIRVGLATGTLALLFVLGRVLVMTPSAEAHADATFTLLYSFKGSPGGANPAADLILDVAGSLYGTTAFGGASDKGTVFKLDTTGAETVLYSFTGAPDGQSPYAQLIRDSAGNFYGTTTFGGASGFGTVFKLDTTGAETVLHSFSGVPDGRYPWGALVRDAAGNLYGTTEYGGAPECNPPYGCGTVFELDTTGNETVLYSFKGGADGRFSHASLIRDVAGNFYGTTGFGGASDSGTLFKLDATGNETVLYSFKGGADGRDPSPGLVRDAADNLYGTPTRAALTARGRCSNSIQRARKPCCIALGQGQRTEYVPSAVCSGTQPGISMAPPSRRCASHGNGLQAGYGWQVDGNAQLQSGRRGRSGPPRRFDPGRGRQPLRHHRIRRRFQRGDGVQAEPLIEMARAMSQLRVELMVTVDIQQNSPGVFVRPCNLTLCACK